ncbi:MAG: DoxX family protein [Candidatus Binataceae bacterium]
MKSINSVGALVGRFLIALIFILSSLQKFTHPDMMIQYMTLARVPLPGVSLYLAAIVEVVGGLTLLLGVLTRSAALLLFLFLIPTTILFHVVPGDPMNRIEVLKNMAIMGGLLIVATQGGGALTLDNLRRSS